MNTQCLFNTQTCWQQKTESDSYKSQRSIYCTQINNPNRGLPSWAETVSERLAWS